MTSATIRLDEDAPVIANDAAKSNGSPEANHFHAVDTTAATPMLSDSEPELLDVDWVASGMTAEMLVTMFVEHSLRMNASDLFLSSVETGVVASVRHLGVIKKIGEVPTDLGVRCFAYIRTAAKMKYGEKGHPQDGRWVYRPAELGGVDLRVNSMPTLWGESLAIRILRRDTELQKLEALGFVGPQLGEVTSALQANSGLLMVTGPTGCGKTTTIYACLHYLNNGRRKIHTIEDPIEYSVAGLHQTQVDSSHSGNGADFIQMLRGVIRQGPDVIMIGEVRDRDTAETAVRAANSGQLVFATLHAAVAATALQSLIGLGVPAHFLATSLLAIVGQRLMRTLRPDTRVAMDLSEAPHTFDEVRPWLSMGEGKIAYAAAANGDRNEGYRGRSGLFEVMAMKPSLRRLIQEQRPASDIHNKAVEEGMLDFRRAAMLKVAHGLTTFDEMQRVLPTGDTWMDF